MTASTRPALKIEDNLDLWAGDGPPTPQNVVVDNVILSPFHDSVSR